MGAFNTIRRSKGMTMSENRETPEERRERMRQKKLKNPSSSIYRLNLSDLVKLAPFVFVGRV